MIAALALATALASAGGETAARREAHLLAGAAAFQRNAFDVALIEFKVARELGAPEAGWYVGAALQKLARSDEAVEAFTAAALAAPKAADALLDFYQALACYDARLYHAADALLVRVTARAGPRIAAEARRTREQLAPVLRATPSTATVDWYLDRARGLIEAGRRPLAARYLEEARALGERRPDRYGVSEAARLGAPNEADAATRTAR